MEKNSKYKNRNQRKQKKPKFNDKQTRNQKQVKVDQDSIQDDEYSQEDISIYPFTRKQFIRVIKNKHFNKYRVIPTNLVPKYIKKQLYQMQDYGYDFLFSASYKQWNKYKKGNQQKVMRRSCYIRFQCPYCFMDLKKQKKRRWTTHGGTIQIRFMIVPLQKVYKQQMGNYRFKKFPYLIIFRHKVYKMKCKKCLRWGKIFIYQRIMEAICQLFCRIIAEILCKIPLRIPKDLIKSQESQEKHPKHEYDLCQACEKGVCLVGKRKNMEILKSQEYD